MGVTKNFGKYLFKYICDLHPDRDQMGKIHQFMPQSRYRNAHVLLLHRYGRGPFCRFRISRGLSFEGVYLLLVNESVQYVGECINLSSRFNIGYGQISPRNCFDGGQSTNCKINHLILETSERNNQIELWFFQTPDREAVESELIAEFKPPWNDQGMF